MLDAGMNAVCTSRHVHFFTIQDHAIQQGSYHTLREEERVISVGESTIIKQSEPWHPDALFQSPLEHILSNLPRITLNKFFPVKTGKKCHSTFYKHAV